MYAISSPRPLKAAIVGPGYIARVHAVALRSLGVEVVALVGRDLTRTRAAAAQLGVPGAFTNLDEVLADLSIDAVHICTPNINHFEQAQAVLAAGKHLVAEKPLTMNSQESAQLVAAAGPNQVGAVAYCYRYYPLVQHLRTLVAKGELGRLHHIGGAYLADELCLPTDYAWGALPEYIGPSVTFADVGIHWCDLAEHISGQRIVELVADVQTVIPERIWEPGNGPQPKESHPIPGSSARAVRIDADDSISLLLRMEDGTRGAVHISRVSPGYKNWIQLIVEGTEASAAWNQEQPNTLEVRRRSPGTLVVGRETGLPGAGNFAFLPPGHPEGYHAAFYNLLHGAYADIARLLAGEPVAGEYPTLADGHRSMLLIEAALTSARERRWVRVGE